jgi:hypothetical protein
VSTESGAESGAESERRASGAECSTVILLVTTEVPDIAGNEDVRGKT